jgi:molybdenum cofactor cytidylyltransferase
MVPKSETSHDPDRSTRRAESRAPAPPISAVILAAGTSSRLGRAKQLLTLENRSLLQHVIDNALASSLDEVVVVLGHDAETIRAALHLENEAEPGESGRLQVVVCPDYLDGQSGSLRTGLDAVRADACAAAILLGDQPGVDAALIDRIVDAFRASDASVVRPLHPGHEGLDEAAGDGPVPGHPVVIDRVHFPALRALRGDEGARSWLRRHPELLLGVSVETPAPADVDTEADWTRLVEARRRASDSS